VAKRLLGDSGRSGQVSPKESLKERLMNKQREGGADDAKKAPGPELAPRQTTLVLLPMLDLSYFFFGGERFAHAICPLICNWSTSTRMISRA